MKINIWHSLLVTLFLHCDEWSNKNDLGRSEMLTFNVYHVYDGCAHIGYKLTMQKGEGSPEVLIPFTPYRKEVAKTIDKFDTSICFISSEEYIKGKERIKDVERHIRTRRIAVRSMD